MRSRYSDIYGTNLITIRSAAANRTGLTSDVDDQRYVDTLDWAGGVAAYSMLL